MVSLRASRNFIRFFQKSATIDNNKKLKDQEGDEVISKQERLISLPNEDRGLTIFETVSSPVKAMNEIGNDS
jgi:hypothetical protein